MGCDHRAICWWWGYAVSIHAPAWGATLIFSRFVLGSQFQSTHPHGVRRGTPSCTVRWSAFQSTHPHGVRHAEDYDIQDEYARFNPRTRMGCDKTQTSATSDHCCFNPRTRMGCDCSSGYYLRAHSSCFNPRTRMGCDPHLVGAYLLGLVSIHAPAWGATTIKYGTRLTSSVSIHAPAWGATLLSLKYNLKNLFQSTHPHGVRRFQPLIFSPGQISFQSTHPHGVRLENYFHGRRSRLFQSTHPHGVRLRSKEYKAPH